jgi:hypothetical protein
MPYKDPEWKKEWERLHRPQRLARRRELRRIEVTQQAAQPWRFGLLERRSSGRGTLEFRISEVGAARLGFVGCIPSDVERSWAGY